MPDGPGVALRGGDARLGDRHHHVGVDRRLARELLAHALARRVHAVAVEHGVGAREVDELEQAELGVGLGEACCVCTPDASITIISPGSTSRTKCAPTMSSAAVSLASTQPPLDPAEHERPEAVRVADADEVRLVHHHEREPALEPRQHLQQRLLEVAAVGPRLATSYSWAMSSATSAESVVESSPTSSPGTRPGQHAELLGELERCW